MQFTDWPKKKCCNVSFSVSVSGFLCLRSSSPSGQLYYSILPNLILHSLNKQISHGVTVSNLNVFIMHTHFSQPSYVPVPRYLCVSL